MIYRCLYTGVQPMNVCPGEGVAYDSYYNETDCVTFNYPFFLIPKNYFENIRKIQKLLEKSRKNQGKISNSSFWKIFDKYKKYWKSQRKIRDSLFWKIFYKYNKNWKSQLVCHLNTSQKWEPCIYVYKIRLCCVYFMFVPKCKSK